MVRRLNTLLRESKANVAILFALGLVPLLLAVGAATDFGRAVVMREKMQGATDAAALALASWKGLSDSERKTKAQQFFDANFPATALGTVGQVSVSSSLDEITVSVSGSVPTSFLKVANIDRLDVGAQSVVGGQLRNIELILVIQAGESMDADGKLDAVKDAAKNMVQTLFDGKDTKDTLKIGVVPFSGAVNIGTQSLNSGWIDAKSLSAIAREDFKPGVKALDLYDKIRNRKWQGCVRERGGSYELTDAPPDSTDSKWAVYFAPDEPDTSSNYVNNYADDLVTGSPDKRQRDTTKYDGLTIPDAASLKGPDFNCPFREVTALTKIQGQVISAIEDLKAQGKSTVIPAGLLWGWRLISPTAPFTDDVAYSNKNWTKAILLFTDGKNDVGGGNNGHNQSVYNAFGFAQSGHLGSTNGSQAEATLDSKTLTVCKNIKANGILLYTVGFQPTAVSKDLLTSCATKPDMYFESPSKTALSDIFQSVAFDLIEVRIAQ